jgi:hypothetical protein
MRCFHFGWVVLICSLQSACGGDVIEPAGTEDPVAGLIGDGGGELPVDTGGGGGTDRPSGGLVVGAAGVDDTGTLSVTVEITAYGLLGESKDEAWVDFWVTVHEWASGSAVTDAVVVAGPVGAPSMLPYNVYSLSSYSESAKGYAGTWEVSVVRGADHLKGLILVGPSYQTVSVIPSPGSATVNWSPSQETGVRSVACARSEDSTTVYETCAEAQDEGSLVLASSAPGGFPSSPYTVTLIRNTKVPVGLGGAGMVHVATSVQVP